MYKQFLKTHKNIPLDGIRKKDRVIEIVLPFTILVAQK